MTREQALARIAADLADIAGVNPADVTEDKTLAGDLGFDSLTTLDVISRIEKRFGVETPLDKWIVTVKDLVDLVVAG